MRMHLQTRHGLRFTRAILFAAFLAFSLATAHAVVIPTVPVGNPGNANDPLTGGLYGGVAYDYRIGTMEVTNAQYAEFLNAKATSSNPLGLYNNFMGSSPFGGISRSGAGTIPDPYVYTTKTDMGNKPVGHVNWYDAIRFANWLHNGQGTGDTETGAYTLLGGSEVPINGQTITRNSGATWFLPSEDEWYKAAYYQPAAEGGDSDGYWLYPTASNNAPTPATANSTGDISNPGANVANYFSAANWNGLNGNVTTVGSAGPLSDSFYGTADQGGNVLEWNEVLINGSARGQRGGQSGSSVVSLQATDRPTVINPAGSSAVRGFRVATIAVPEPSTYALAAICVITLLAVRRRKNKAAGPAGKLVA